MVTELIYKKVNYLGVNINGLTPIDLGRVVVYKEDFKVQYWKIKCEECGRIFESTKQKIFRDRVGGCSKCVYKKRRFQDCKLWDSNIKFVPGIYYSNIKNRCEKLNREFSITREYIDKLLIEQNFKCVYSGLEIGFTDGRGNGNASLDRIDSSKGYTPDNVQWVHKDINTIKMDLSHKEFIHLCRLVAENNKE